MIGKSNGYMFSCLLCCLLMACDTPEYSASKSFEDQCWSIEDTMQYAFDVSKEMQEGISFQTFMDFDENFGYRNIYLKALLKGPEGIETDWVIADTLIDSLGYWISDHMNTPISGTQKVVPKGVGAYQIELIQYLRDSNLCNIKAVHIQNLP